MNVYVCVCKKWNEGGILANHDLDAAVCFAISFKFLVCFMELGVLLFKHNWTKT